MIKSKKDTDASRKRKRESAPVACSSCRKQHLKVRSAFLVVTRLVSRCSRSRRCGVTCAQHSRTFVRSLYGVRRSRASRAPRVVHACSERFVARVRQKSTVDASSASGNHHTPGAQAGRLVAAAGESWSRERARERERERERAVGARSCASPWWLGWEVPEAGRALCVAENEAGQFAPERFFRFFRSFALSLFRSLFLSPSLSLSLSLSLSRQCNGESPCQQCIKRKQESSCQFLAPQKRGPKSQELRQLIEQLQAENLQQRERLERYEAGFGLLPDDGSSSSSMSPSSPSSSPVSLKSVHLSLPSLTMAAESRALVTNRHIFHLGLLNQYLDTFLAYIHPHMKIMNAQPLLGPTRSSLLSLVYDPPKSLMGQAAYVQMNSLLALGARYARALSLFLSCVPAVDSLNRLCTI